MDRYQIKLDTGFGAPRAAMPTAVTLLGTCVK